ncbi:MAG TPA: DUF4136 domain-containing protein [Rubrivivax sp.]|nr:DUF4136 domain-containing protein [Rubrivivax sp.]
MQRRSMTLLLAGALATPLTLGLGGCAAMRSVSSEISTFGDWPANRKPGTYAFERLPSQQARAEQMQALEAAAAPALLKAGFRPVAAGQEPDVLVQVGQRAGRADTLPWADPLWWRGSFGYYRHGPWIGPRWGMSLQMDLRYEREVALLIRERADGKPLFEARASNEGNSAQAGGATLAAMFEACLMDFPRHGVNPRTVVVAVP